MRSLGLIPEAWVEKTPCPVCKASPLTLENALEADRLVCARCGAAFEVEDGGPHVRLVRLPTVAHAAPDGLWRTPAETRAWVRELALRPLAASAPTPPEPPSAASLPVNAAPAPAAPLIETELRNDAPSHASVLNLESVHAQARELLKLSHTPPQIKTILERPGNLTAEQIESVMAEVEQLYAQSKAKERRALRLIVSGALSLVMLCGLVTALANIRPGIASAGALPTSVGGNPRAPTPTPLSLLDHLLRPVVGVREETVAHPTTGGAPIDRSNLPAPLQTLLPPGITVLEQPTPTIRQGDGPPASSCPRTREEAAALFGGVPELWQIESATQGWMLFSNGEPVTVRVPANMTLGYLLVEQSLNMSITNVSGPATVENVYFGALSCQ